MIKDSLFKNKGNKDILPKIIPYKNILSKAFSSAKGFSLIEILVTIAVLSIISLPFLSTFTRYIGMNKTSIDRYYAAVAAQNTLEDIKGLTLQEIIDLTNEGLKKIGEYYISVDICPVLSREDWNDGLSIVFREEDNKDCCLIFHNNLSGNPVLYDISLYEEFKISICALEDGNIELSLFNKEDQTDVLYMNISHAGLLLNVYTYSKPDEIPAAISLSGFDSDDIKVICYDDLFNINDVSYEIDGISAVPMEGMLHADNKDIPYRCYKSEKHPKLFLGVRVSIYREPDCDPIVQRHTYTYLSL